MLSLLSIDNKKIYMDGLNSLQKRNNSLKSKLRHKQLKYGIYPFKKLNKNQLKVLNAYKSNKSLCKAASSLGMDKHTVMDWYIWGMCGNPNFRQFYLAVAHINGDSTRSHEDIVSQVGEIKKEDKISKIGNAWVYTTQIDDKKISVMSGDLDNLKQRINSQNLSSDY